MRKAAIGLCAWLTLTGQLAVAQEKEASPPGEAQAPPAEAPAEPPAAEAPGAERPAEASPAAEAAGPMDARQLWKDILVVPRRHVLKRRRVEIMPTYNVTLNDPLIRHHGLGGALNVYLSEALFLGLEGTYYLNDSVKDPRSRYYLLGLQQRVIPSVNRYVFSALLDFGYVPIAGKFTLFGRPIGHWELYIAAGGGVFMSEVLPRDPASEAFSNISVAILLPGVGARAWLGKYFALDFYLKDYLFLDKLEASNRTSEQKAEMAKANAETRLTPNLVFGLGISIFLPGFEYKLPR